MSTAPCFGISLICYSQVLWQIQDISNVYNLLKVIYTHSEDYLLCNGAGYILCHVTEIIYNQRLNLYNLPFTDLIKLDKIPINF